MLPTKDIAKLILGYTPNNTLAIVGIIAYGTVGLALFFRVVKSRARWALCLPIGSFGEALGFTLRDVAIYKPNSSPLFSIQQLLIVCSPAAFLAFNYMLYGRLISHIGAEHSKVNPQKVAKIFVISDISTFLIQAGGSGLMATNVAYIGLKVALAGLTLQFVSYGLFCALLIKAHISVKSGDIVSFSTYKSCRVLIRALYFSSVFIFIRFTYRVAEFSEGRTGYLFTHEVFFYTLDVLPMLFAIAVYIPWWPTKYLKHDEPNDLNEDAVSRILWL